MFLNVYCIIYPREIKLVVKYKNCENKILLLRTEIHNISIYFFLLNSYIYRPLKIELKIEQYIMQQKVKVRRYGEIERMWLHVHLNIVFDISVFASSINCIASNTFVLLVNIPSCLRYIIRCQLVILLNKIFLFFLHTQSLM